MANIQYLGLKSLEEPETEQLKNIIETYTPKFERQVPNFKLKVSVKKSRILGKMARFNINFRLESKQRRFHSEQNGWGLIKTTRRCGEHMQTLLEKQMSRERERK
ncbi:MAG: hypothetical protein V1914_01525 [archaeon]